MPTHQHTKHKSKPHEKQKKAFAKQTKAFAKPQKSHAKQSKSATKTVIPPTLTLARLQEMRALVKANNRSNQSDEMVICQIYMESKFDKNAGGSGSSAKGLMQVLKGAVAQLFQNHYEKEHGKIKRGHEDILKLVHKQGEAFHNSSQMFDEATNIQYGTEYLQDRIDKYGLSKGYAMYRGVTKGPSAGIYFAKISACAVKLKTNPNSLEALEDIFKK